MSEVTTIQLLDAMAPASPRTSRNALELLRRFSEISREEAAGNEGQKAYEIATSLGGIATALGYTRQAPPSVDGRYDDAVKHIHGSEISLT